MRRDRGYEPEPATEIEIGELNVIYISKIFLLYNTDWGQIIRVNLT